LDIPQWLQALEPEDVNFIRRFVLASGSLKEMAQQYKVSYPTIRSRLDALITKINATSEDTPETATKRLVRELVGRGELDLNTARRIIDASERDRKAQARQRPSSS